jgi:hypothetical protein
MGNYGSRPKKFIVKRVMGELQVLDYQELGVLLSTKFDTHQEINGALFDVIENQKTTVDDLFISQATPSCGDYYNGYYIVDHLVIGNSLHVKYLNSSGMEETVEYEKFFTEKVCLHPNRYYNKLFRTLAFWVCPDCKKEL